MKLGLKFFKRIGAGWLAAVLAMWTFTIGSLPLQAEENSSQWSGFESLNENSYRAYIMHWEQAGALDTQGYHLVYGMDTLSDFDGVAEIHPVNEGDSPALIWEKDEKFAQWTVDVPETGFYELHIEYMTIEDAVDTPKRALKIDGELPFKEAMGVSFYRLWTDNGIVRAKTNGDELRPESEELKIWQTRPLYDRGRLYTMPLRIYLTQGKHTIELEHVRGALAIQKLLLESPRQIPSYEEKRQEYQQMGYQDAEYPIRFEAETKTIRTDSSIQMQYDEDPVTYPSSMDNRKLNAMGGAGWSTLGQTITWSFDISETGLYKLYLRSNQNYSDGLNIYRQIAIDGQIPFKEMEAYPFTYQDSWRVEELAAPTGEPYLFYLEAGSHTLSMTNVLGPAADIVNALELDAFALSEIIQNIILITGNTPDLNYDYEIGKYAPGVIEALQELGEKLPAQIEQIQAISSYKPAVLNNLVLLQSQIKEMVTNPYIIPRKLNDITNSQMAIGDWISQLRSTPLLIDYLVFAPKAQQLEKGQSTFWQRAVKFFKNFINSFIEDYDKIEGLGNDTEIDAVIDVWVSRGKEWVELMQELTDEQFTSQTGIGVRFNTVPAGQLNVGGLNTLMLANASGTAPDVACGVDSGLPVEFGIRGATVDLTDFPDYSDVENRFVPNINVPFQYNGAVFALPETMNFMVQFYRTDIFERLGLTPPNTWDELYTQVLPRLSQNNMNFYYAPSIQSFTPILLQNDGHYYTEDGLTCALDTDEAYEAFVKWTELYSVYKVPVSANFFNQFRSGEMPLGISDFNFYTQLSVAAPELQGRYAIAPMIGTLTEDGTIDRSACGGTTGIVMMEQCQLRNEAWKFMSWWMEEETQIEYGYMVESYFGLSARWASANYAAFQELPWDLQDLEVIQEQYKYYQDIPNVLGGYFTSRHVNNAWNRIIMENMNPRDSLEKAVKDINTEMRNKQKQYLG